jgi:hypothetical protein
VEIKMADELTTLTFDCSTNAIAAVEKLRNDEYFTPPQWICIGDKMIQTKWITWIERHENTIRISFTSERHTSFQVGDIETTWNALMKALTNLS